MKKPDKTKELEKRIKELEERIEQLEKRPPVVINPLMYPSYNPYNNPTIWPWHITTY